MIAIQALQELDQNIQSFLREVGKYIETEFNNFSFSQVQYKGKHDLFTHVDVQVEKQIRDHCEALIPGSGFINEESKSIESKNGYVWIIDPIDGTTNFTHGIPFFCISLALQFNEETYLGYVFNPTSKELYSAIRSHGAFCNGEPIQVSTVESLKESLVSTSFPPFDFQPQTKYWAMLSAFIDASHGLRRLGSAALEMAYVASGKLEAYFDMGLRAWDVAAGGLLIEEAGGKVSDFREKNSYLFGKQLIASNGKVHQRISSLIQESELFNTNP